MNNTPSFSSSPFGSTEGNSSFSQATYGEQKGQGGSQDRSFDVADDLFKIALVTTPLEEMCEKLANHSGSRTQLAGLLKKAPPENSLLLERIAALSLRIFSKEVLPDWVRQCETASSSGLFGIHSGSTELVSVMDLVRQGRLADLKKLNKEKGESWLTIRDEDNNSVLHVALQGYTQGKGDQESMKMAKWLVKQCPQLLVAVNRDHELPLDFLDDYEDDDFADELASFYHPAGEQPSEAMQAMYSLAFFCRLKDPFWARQFLRNYVPLLKSISPEQIKELPAWLNPFKICLEDDNDENDKFRLAEKIIRTLSEGKKDKKEYLLDYSIGWACSAGIDRALVEEIIAYRNYRCSVRYLKKLEVPLEQKQLFDPGQRPLLTLRALLESGYPDLAEKYLSGKILFMFRELGFTSRSEDDNELKAGILLMAAPDMADDQVMEQIRKILDTNGFVARMLLNAVVSQSQAYRNCLGGLFADCLETSPDLLQRMWGQSHQNLFRLLVLQPGNQRFAKAILKSLMRSGYSGPVVPYIIEAALQVRNPDESQLHWIETLLEEVREHQGLNLSLYRDLSSSFGKSTLLHTTVKSDSLIKLELLRILVKLFPKELRQVANHPAPQRPLYLVFRDYIETRDPALLDIARILIEAGADSNLAAKNPSEQSYPICLEAVLSGLPELMELIERKEFEYEELIQVLQVASLNPWAPSPQAFARLLNLVVEQGGAKAADFISPSFLNVRLLRITSEEHLCVLDSLDRLVGLAPEKLGEFIKGFDVSSYLSHYTKPFLVQRGFIADGKDKIIDERRDTLLAQMGVSQKVLEWLFGHGLEITESQRWAIEKLWENNPHLYGTPLSQWILRNITGGFCVSRVSRYGLSSTKIKTVPADEEGLKDLRGLTSEARREMERDSRFKKLKQNQFRYSKDGYDYKLSFWKDGQLMVQRELAGDTKTDFKRKGFFTLPHAIALMDGDSEARSLASRISRVANCPNHEISSDQRWVPESHAVETAEFAPARDGSRRSPIILKRCLDRIEVHFCEAATGKVSRRDFLYSNPSVVEEIKSFIESHKKELADRMRSLQEGTSIPCLAPTQGRELRQVVAEQGRCFVVADSGLSTTLFFKLNAEHISAQTTSGIPSAEQAKSLLEKVDRKIKEFSLMKETLNGLRGIHLLSKGEGMFQLIEKGMGELFRNISRARFVALGGPQLLMLGAQDLWTERPWLGSVSLQELEKGGEQFLEHSKLLEGYQLSRSHLRFLNFHSSRATIHNEPCKQKLTVLREVLEGLKDHPTAQEFLSRRSGCTYEGLQSNLSRFLRNLAEKKNIQGFNNPPEKYKEAYDQMEIQLTHAVHKLVTEERHEGLNQLALELSYISQYCGPRIAETIQTHYQLAFGLIETQEFADHGIDGLIQRVYANAALEAMEQMLAHMKHTPSKRQSIHALNYIRHALEAAGYKLPPDPRVTNLEDNWVASFGVQDYPKEKLPAIFEGLLIPLLMKKAKELQDELIKEEKWDKAGLFFACVRDWISEHGTNELSREQVDRLNALQAEQEETLKVLRDNLAARKLERENLSNHFPDWAAYQQAVVHLDTLNEKVSDLSRRTLQMAAHLSELERDRGKKRLAPSANGEPPQKRAKKAAQGTGYEKLICDSAIDFVSTEKLLDSRIQNVAAELERTGTLLSGMEQERDAVGGIIEKVRSTEAFSQVLLLDEEMARLNEEIEATAQKYAGRLAQECEEICEKLGYVEYDEILCLPRLTDSGIAALLRAKGLLEESPELMELRNMKKMFEMDCPTAIPDFNIPMEELDGLFVDGAERLELPIDREPLFPDLNIEDFQELGGEAGGPV